MFLDDADMDKTCLRQGDILKNVLYPLVVTDEVRFLGIADPSAKPVALPWQVEEITLRNSPAWKCQMFTRIGFVAVISQCCDIAPTNERRITRQSTIALARLVPVPAGPAKNPEKLASLQANK